MEITRNKSDTIIYFFSTFLLITIFYRTCFFFEIIKTKLIPPYASFQFIVSGFVSDLFTGTTTVACFLILRLSYQHILAKHLNSRRSIFIVENVLLCFILLIINLIDIAHRKLVTMFVMGFNYPIFLSIIHNLISPKIGIPYLNTLDWVFIFSPILLYLSMLFLPYRFFLNLLIGLISLIFSIFSISCVIDFIWPPFVNPTSSWMSGLLIRNPTQYLVQNTWESQTNVYEKRHDLPDAKQQQTVQLIDPLFVVNKSTPATTTAATTQKRPMNVVVFFMESVSSEYIFSKSSTHSIPMPFLESLSHKGLWLNNTYSTGNMSSLGNFGVFSGLYPHPKSQLFELLPSLSIPSMADWLGTRYDTLLVTPTMTSLYFPLGLVRSFKKFYSPDNIPHKDALLYNTFLPENIGFDFFLSQLDKMHQPFASVYMSVSAHYPYLDYDPHSHIAMPVTLSYNRYINNLRLLDQEIEQLYLFLQKKHWLDNTLLIITSDHGEGFGQHPGSWIHSNALYDEQTRVPLLFYNTSIFKPQIINKLTSTVDILPTMLDAMGLPYKTHCIQGESLLRANLQRKYIFIYGAENEFATVDQHSNKMIIDYANGVCRQYNLKNDPQELHSEACKQLDQEHGSVAFKNYQAALLENYNLTGVCI